MPLLHVLASADPSALPPLWRWTTKWGYFLGLAAGIGLPALHVLAVRPALRRHAGPSGGARTTDVTHRVIGAGALVLAATYVPQLVSTTARGLETGFGAAWSPAAVRRLLTQPAEEGAWLGAGALTVAQLFLVIAAVALLVPLVRRSGTAAAATRSVRWAERRVSLGLAAAVLASLVLAVPRSSEDLGGEALAGAVLEQAHIVGASIWVGGLVGLTLLTRARSGADGTGLEVWADIWRRFSLVASLCVGALAVSGAWLAWKHVGSLGQLVTTTYGLLLSAKLVLVGALLGLGGFNQVVLMPRIARLRAAGHREPALRLATQHFGGVVRVEAVIGVGVLLLVGFLSGSARKQAGGDPAEVGTTVLAWGGALVVGIALLILMTARVAAAVAARPLPSASPEVTTVSVPSP